MSGLEQLGTGAASQGGILARLTAAGIGRARPRSVIQAEIAAVKKVLAKLKDEHRRAVARETMKRVRNRPDAERRRLEGLARVQGTPEYREKQRAGAKTAHQPNRLPPMTKPQYRHYFKLRWTGLRLSREAALKEVLG